MSRNQATGALSNTQLELLKTFSHELSEADLKELRKRLASFFAEKLIQKADKYWDSKKINEEAVLYKKLRASKRQK